MALRLLESSDSDERARGVELAAELRRQGRCAVCGRRLTDPLSVGEGIGPDCKAKRRHAHRALTALRQSGFDVLDPDVFADAELPLPADGIR